MTSQHILYLLVEGMFLLHDGLPLYEAGAKVVIVEEEWPNVGPQLRFHTPKEDGST